MRGVASDCPDRDEALMAAVREGDLQAFDTLYARQHRAVFGFALRSLGDRGTAEDVLQRLRWRGSLIPIRRGRGGCSIPCR